MRGERAGFRERLRHAWNAFTDKDQEMILRQDIGTSYAFRPDRIRLRPGSEKTIVASIYNRIGIDVAAVRILHAKLDENERYVETVDSGLNYCLNTEANLDQTGRALIQDLVMSMCDEGVVAIVPVETNFNPRLTGGYDIKQLRIGKILEWYPEHVRIRLYDQREGKQREIVLPKKIVGIIQNPLYDVMNEPNSTLKRLVYKLNILDAIDEQTGSGKLDLIIHLPYVTKTELQQKMAEERRKALEQQLASSKYGVAYADAAEKVTQLNRPVENNLMDQIEYLTSMLYSQLGMTKEVFEGTANEETMLNYYSRTIEPIVSAICDEFNRKFLTKTARSQNQKIMFFRDLFKLAPTETIANVGRSFVDGEIMAPNEVRQVIGLKPSQNPDADELRNRNVSATPVGGTAEEMPMEDPEAENAGATRVSDLM